MEILSPSGSFASLKAAVFAGADAVYFGGTQFNARENASNFSEKEIFEAVLFCHERGVKCFAVLNTLVRDREFSEVFVLAKAFISAGIDAFIVQDLALANFLIKNTNVAVHASTQLTVHSLDGALFLYNMGFKRIVLSRELSKEDISHIVRGVPEGCEIEVFVHGALCMCYSGQCYMSSIIGKRSGNRGLCAQPCRLPYQNGYTLSLKDLSLLRYVSDLEKMGVTSLKIEGRMKSPEYAYAVTKAYANAKNGMPFSEDEEGNLAEVFSRNGFTRGYFENRLGKEMFGTKSEKSKKILIEEKEEKRFGIFARLFYKGNDTLELHFASTDGFSAVASLKCQQAQSRPTTPTEAGKSLTKFGNTVYFLAGFEAEIPEDIFIAVSEMNRARRECIESLSLQRTFKANYLKEKPFLPLSRPAFSAPEKFRGVFLNPGEIPENAEKLEAIWLPLIAKNEEAVLKFGKKVGFFLPRIFHDSEKNSIRKLLENALEMGVRKFLCGNIGQIAFLNNFALERGVEIEIHGDYGLNIFNSQTSRFFEEKLASAVLSFELPFPALKAFSNEKTGIIAYGRLPFMIMKNCVKERHGKPEILTDRRGKKMLLTCDFGCRNSLWNADKLWLGDKDLSSFGFSVLLFTDEKKAEAEAVIESYMKKSPPPAEYTRGLYF